MPFRVPDVIRPNNSETNKFGTSFYQVIDTSDINMAVAGFQTQLGITTGTDLTTITGTGSYKFIVDDISKLPAAISGDIYLQSEGRYGNFGYPATGDIIGVVRNIYRQSRGITFELYLDASNTGDSVKGANANTPFGPKGTMVYNAFDTKYYGLDDSGWSPVGDGVPYTKGMTAPSDPVIGEKWFETRTSLEFTYLGAGDGWVAVNVAAGSTGAEGRPGAVGLTGSGYTGATIENGELYVTPVDNFGGSGTPINLGRVQGENGIAFAIYESVESSAEASQSGKIFIDGLDNTEDGEGQTNPRVFVNVTEFRGTDLQNYWDALFAESGEPARDATIFIVSQTDPNKYLVLRMAGISSIESSGQVYYQISTEDVIAPGNPTEVAEDFIASGVGSAYSIYYVLQGKRGVDGTKGTTGATGNTGATGSVGTFSIVDGAGNILTELANPDAIEIGPWTNESVVKIIGNIYNDDDGSHIGAYIDVRGDQNTGITKDTNPSSWSSVPGWRSRRFLTLQEDGSTTFEFVRVGDIWQNSDFSLSILDIGFGSIGSDPDEEIYSKPVREFIGPAGAPWFLSQSNNANNNGGRTTTFNPFYDWLRVKFGPYNPPDTSSGVTLSLTSGSFWLDPQTRNFAGRFERDPNASIGAVGDDAGTAVSPYYFYLGPTAGNNDNLQEPITLDSVDDISIALKYPSGSNNPNVTMKVRAQVDGDVAEKTLTVQFGNKILLGLTKGYDSGNLNTLISSMSTLDGRCEAFDGHGVAGTVSWELSGDLTPYVKSNLTNSSSPFTRSWSGAAGDLNEEGPNNDSYFYIAYPTSWFNNGGNIAQNQVEFKNGIETSTVNFAKIGTGILKNTALGEENYTIWRSSQADQIDSGTDGYISFTVSEG